MKITNPSANVTILTTDKATILFSYGVPVAANFAGAFHRTNKFWSKTTSKHINAWLDGAKAHEKDQDFFNILVGE